MLDFLEISRFIVAFFASGIFWLMVLFYAEKRWRDHGLPGAGVAAAIVLTAAAVLFFKVVVDDAPWKTPPPLWDETTYSAPAAGDRPVLALSVDADLSGRSHQRDGRLDDGFLAPQR
jgi:hypothetical protein